MHKDVAQCRHLARQHLVVFFLALVQTAILKQDHLTGLNIDAIHPIAHQPHLTTEQLAESDGHRCQ